MANYLGYEFVDAAEVIFFEEDGTFDTEKTNKVLAKRLEKCGACGNSGILRGTAGRNDQDLFQRRFRHHGIHRGACGTCHLL